MFNIQKDISPLFLKGSKEHQSVAKQYFNSVKIGQNKNNKEILISENDFRVHSLVLGDNQKERMKLFSNFISSYAEKKSECYYFYQK